jgi:hypothetical protein
MKAPAERAASSTAARRSGGMTAPVGLATVGWQ